MNISEKISTFPDYAKDIKLNYSKILNETIFDKNQLYSLIVISSIATNNKELQEFALKEAETYLDESNLNDIYGAYSIMSMNAIYYRFTHLAKDFDYASLPANLRMQYLNNHNMSKSNFEMLCLAVLPA